MRIAFVVQRYGTEVNGGAELEARLIAEHVSPYVQVEVLTSCAIDYMTWQNHYAPGLTTLNGIPVRRFPVHTPRDVQTFNQFSSQIFCKPHSYYDEIHWMTLQGPDVPDLFQFIREHHQDYDLFVFFTYLYSTTFQGIQIVPFKSILFPTAHDENWIYFDIFRTVFNLPRAFIFNSAEEERFVRKRFDNAYIPGAVLGVGIELPPVPPVQVLDEDYVIYLGRIDQAKGCKELFEYFLAYKSETNDPVKLVLIGTQAMQVPSHPDILSLGFMGEERFTWLQHAQLLVLPSPHESLSLATLEAWAMEIPVLVNGAAIVLKDHCLRSQGGLYFESEGQFISALRRLRLDAALRAKLSARGKVYVDQHYQWEKITKDYIAFFRRTFDEVYSHTRR
jgi:glycosyltransferase involved in cell wall biosynthesis